MLSSISIPEAAPLNPAANDYQMTWRLLRYGWRYRGQWLMLILATGAMAAFAGYLVLLVQKVLEVMQEADSGKTSGLYGLVRLGFQSLVLAPLAALAYGGSWFLGQLLANSCIRDLRNDVLAHLVQLDLAFHQRLSRGDLLNRMTSDIDSTGELLHQIYGKVLQRPAEALGTVVFLFYVNWRFAADSGGV